VFFAKDMTLTMHRSTFQRWGQRTKALVAREVLLGLVSVRMSSIAFHLDYYVFPPVILGGLYLSSRQMSASFTFAGYTAGLVGWTLAEYLLHRFVLHRWPHFSDFHKAHHDEPRAMIGSPAVFSMLVFTLSVFLPVYFLAGAGTAFAVFAGFLSGYVAFAAVHEAVHHSEWQGPLLRHFKKLHAIHHHGDSSKNFGVLTGVWDTVFGTSGRRLARPHRK
jgi:sterol desaturase/sphingolipid hydroxylase (fatty acid hydroxylase superfamily)